MSSRAIDGYIDEKRADGKPVAVVKGLHRYFAIDGHHTLSAILAVSPSRELLVDQVEDFSGIDAESFWQKMKARGFYLNSALVRPIEPADFPAQLSELQDANHRARDDLWVAKHLAAHTDTPGMQPGPAP